MGRVNVKKMAKCALCDAPIEVPETETTDWGRSVRVGDPGTLYTHLREAHPDRWAEICQAQRAVNALIDPVPRKIDGTLLLPGEDVGDLLERRS
jgi:hypothetical protein